jgi:hypothetical protein
MTLYAMLAHAEKKRRSPHLKKPGSYTIVRPTPANPLNSMIIETSNVIRIFLQRCVIRIVDYLYENHSKAWSN